MVRLLAKTSALHPWRVISAWLIIAFLAGCAALTGLGQGGLFSRMESQTTISEGTDSSRVTDIVAKDSSYQIVATLSGVSHPDSLNDDVLRLAQDIEKITGVDTVISTPGIISKAIDTAKKVAVKTASESYQKNKAQAEQEIRSQIESTTRMLMARGLPAQAAQQRATQEVQARLAAQPMPSEENVIAQAQAEAEKQATEKASPQANKLKAHDGYALVISLKKGASETKAEEAISSRLTSFESAHKDSGVKATYTSRNSARTAINDAARHDLVRGEIIGLPVALILMVLVFGGLLTAMMPLLGAIAAILITLGGVWGLTFVMNVDSFVLNVVSILGLALSIDYGLLVVSRYREEINRIMSEENIKETHTLPEDKARPLITQALITTVDTAGRTVIFSAITIAVAIAGLFAIASSIMRVIAIGGFVVVLLAVISAASLTPALLAVSGRRLMRPSSIDRIPGLHKILSHVKDQHTDHGVFSKLAIRVQRHPWIIMTIITACLVAMVVPMKDLTLRTEMESYVPSASSPGITTTTLKNDYPELTSPTAIVLVKGSDEQTKEVSEWLKKRDNISTVREATDAGSGWKNIGVVVKSSDSVGEKAINAVKDIRTHVDDATKAEVLVGGQAAMQIDFNQVLLNGTPWAFSIVIVAVLILLFLLTGSVLIPIKAIIINSMSLAASMGLTMFLFEYGAFGLPKTEGLTAFVVACGIAFGFGLAMDYEVFLVARMKEYWDSGETNNRAVSLGLQRSGRIITSAAAIIVAVFIGFCFGDMLAIKEIGVMLAIMVIADATLTRMLLVPATMTVMGKWNWWAPKWMSGIYRRFGISESGHHRKLESDVTLEEHKENKETEASPGEHQEKTTTHVATRSEHKEHKEIDAILGEHEENKETDNAENKSEKPHGRRALESEAT